MQPLRGRPVTAVWPPCGRLATAVWPLQVWAVVDLLREGRSTLATSFATWKFLIIYGQAAA